MNILLMLAHSIEEHDQIKLLSGLGYDVFSIGGYIDPSAPHDPKRPALPDAPRHPDLKAIVDGLGTADNLDYAKRIIPDDILDWADTIICHHYEHSWLVPQWERIKHKRVIWRTVGQSVDGNEAMMAPLRKDGLQIVRYSPKERNIPNFAGEDALIRFYKDPDEWQGWTGHVPAVINFTQHLAQRDPYTNYGFWKEATAGLDAIPMGPGSEAIGGTGERPLEDMQQALRDYRVYLYTGTQPASYTLGLIEAMMTGIPVVSITPRFMGIFPYGHLMFEGHEIAQNYGDPPDKFHRSDEQVIANTREMLSDILRSNDRAIAASKNARNRAIELFGKDKIGAEWKAFLGA